MIGTIVIVLSVILVGMGAELHVNNTFSISTGNNILSLHNSNSKCAHVQKSGRPDSGTRRMTKQRTLHCSIAIV